MKVKNMFKNIVSTGFIYYFIRVVVLYAFVILLFQGDWKNAISTAFIFLLMITPELLKKKYKTRTPIELDIAMSLFVFFTLYLGSFQNFYEKFPWFDITLHFLSGILLGMIGFVLVYLLNESDSKRIHLSPGFISFFAVSFSALISVLWEIFEFAGDSILGFNMQKSGIPDTMGDFIVNMTGALIVAVIGYFWMRRNKKLPFTLHKLTRSR